jgi:hypothetical protein
MDSATSDFSASGTLDVRILSRLFADTTNSYKILFFRSLVRAFAESHFQTRTFRLDDLATEMLVDATYPVLYFHLSLGSADQIPRLLSRIHFPSGKIITMNAVRAAVKPLAAEVQKLLRYVPTRLLSPFCFEDLRGQPDHLRDDIVQRLADDRFNVLPVLYRLTPPDNLELHPLWVATCNKIFQLSMGGWSGTGLDFCNPEIQLFQQFQIRRLVLISVEA